jgi:hypothetical protein
MCCQRAAPLQPRASPDQPFSPKTVGGWVCFWGKAQFGEGKVTVTPETNKACCGFYKKLVLDPQAHPEVEVSVPECAGKWTLTLKWADGVQTVITTNGQAGVLRAEYLSKLKSPVAQECEVSFRVYGGATFDGLRFPAAAAAAAAALPVRFVAPLPRSEPYAAVARRAGVSCKAELTVRQNGGQQ